MNFPRVFGFGSYCNKGPGGAVEKQWVCRSRSALKKGAIPHLQPGPWSFFFPSHPELS